MPKNFIVPGLDEVPGEVGFKDFEPGMYQFKYKEVLDQTKPQHEEAGRQSFEFVFEVEAVLSEDMDETDVALFTGRTYKHRIFLLEEGHLWRSIGMNQLKNLLNAFGIKVKKGGGFAAPAGSVARAAGKMIMKQDKPYEKDGEMITPKAKATVAEWFAIEEDE